MPLIFQSTAVARPAYYDRNGIQIGASFEAALPPHGATNRWSYTVPVGKAAYIESLYAYMVRQTAPGANVYSECYCVALLNGVTTDKFFDLVFNGAVPFTPAYINQTSFGFMRPGDVLFGTSQSSDTGGANTYGIAFKGTQFDL